MNDQRELWQAWGRGEISDDEAQAAAEAAHKPRPSKVVPLGVRLIAGTFRNARVSFPVRRVQRSPDRQRSIERRRRLAMSGPMPPQLACQFTVGELAALRIVANAATGSGGCRLHIDAIAAQAGVCRTTVVNALRAARRLGLVTVQERRRRGLPSLTNVVRIVSREWRAWLDRRGGGCKKMRTPDIRNSYRERNATGKQTLGEIPPGLKASAAGPYRVTPAG
jgi:hypothetical protein